MKREKFIYGLGSTLVIAGVVMQIMHLPYGKEVFLFALIGMTVFQSWHVAQLTKRIKDLEGKS